MKRLALITAGGLLAAACSEPAPPGAVHEGASLLSDVRITEMRDNRHHWKLSSVAARFEDGETRLYFDHPEISFYDDDKPSSELKAETGFINMAEKEAQLERNVVVNSRTDGMTLLTSRLFFSSAKNKIWTDDPVTILKGDTVTRGRGFTANPDLSEIVINRQETTTNRTSDPGKNKGG
ncbi:MAG TPA: LPS export ABC transporter periplasmic protein LptC [Elusimicrobiales bacterium]|nr:LPS export ABC transporter periplasmic protein LptC [Elusimicrobiales bacterium]